MSWYEKLPVRVKAAKILSVDENEATFDVGDGETDWLQEATMKTVGDIGGIWVLNKGVRIGTLEGTMRANAGDYLVSGIEGELYAVREDIFKKSYRQVDGP